jgi:hypothetical protein
MRLPITLGVFCANSREEAIAKTERSVAEPLPGYRNEVIVIAITPDGRKWTTKCYQVKNETRTCELCGEIYESVRAGDIAHICKPMQDGANAAMADAATTSKDGPWPDSHQEQIRADEREKCAEIVESHAGDHVSVLLDSGPAQLSMKCFCEHITKEIRRRVMNDTKRTVGIFEMDDKAILTGDFVGNLIAGIQHARLGYLCELPERVCVSQ